MFSLLLHAIWATIVLWLLHLIYTSRPTGFALARDSEVLRYAAQIGRLDFVSLALSILGVVLAVAAFGGFFLMRSAAINASHDEVQEQLRRNGDAWVAKHAVAYMAERGDELIERWIESNPAKLRKAVKLALSADDDSIDADGVVGSLDDENLS